MRRNILLGAVSVAVFFGLIEAALRLSGRVPTDALRSPDRETLDTIPGLFQPGQEFVDRIRPDLSYHVRINSLGLRGAEFSPDKEAGSVRVLCLGDSYTFGAHVEDEQAFPAVLGRMLRALLAPESRQSDVINAGANGFTIADELIFLREKGLALNPDIIILAFSQNDILDLARPRPMIQVMQDHADLKSRLLIGPAMKLLQRTALFNGMQRAAAWLKVKEARDAATQARAQGPELWQEYRGLLADLFDVVRNSGARLLLVAWPSAEQIAGSEPLTPQERLAGFAQGLGIEYLDLTPVMQDLSESGVNPFQVPLDGHPSVDGHEAAARAIASRLHELGHLPERT